jgi:hypothetical protein
MAIGAAATVSGNGRCWGGRDCGDGGRSARLVIALKNQAAAVVAVESCLVES